MKIEFTWSGYRPINTIRYGRSRTWFILTYFRIHISGLKEVKFDDWGKRIKS